MRRGLCALLCTAAAFAAGCHNNNQDSGYGIGWVTFTAGPSDFTSYIVNVDAVTLTRNDGAVVQGLATVETVDFTKLDNIAELFGSATLPIGTYTSISIELDYTAAVVSVMKYGAPVVGTVVAPGSTTPLTTQTITILFDAANPLVIPPTFATTSAQRIAIDFNLTASTASIDLAPVSPTIVTRPYMTAAIAPADTKPIRVRGPLINSDVALGTYSIYERPFHDAVDNLGTLTLFTNADTIFTTNGTVLQGTNGLTQLSQSSAGSTITAAYVTYTPTPTVNATAGVFNALYVVAGSTLEDVYTSGMEGDVIARNGNQLTLRGATLTLNDGVSTYLTEPDAQVALGPSTLVTADNTLLTGLNYNSVGVGQHIIARGLNFVSGTTTILDATGATTTNTGSVRLISTQLYGSAVSAATGNVVLNLATINNWPISDFNFAGNGSTAASNPVSTAFAVNTGTLPIPAVTAGDPVWIDGRVTAFGSAPPDFTAVSVNNEASVQTAGTTPTSLTPLSCGEANFDCVPASMQVVWSGAGTTAPFSGLTATAMRVDLKSTNFLYGVIRIGPESIDMTTLPAAPIIVPTSPTLKTLQTANVTGAVPVYVPQMFLPDYSYGNPLATAPAGINVFSNFGIFATGLADSLAGTATVAAAAALQLEARGNYDRATNTFYAITVNVVL